MHFGQQMDGRQQALEEMAMHLRDERLAKESATSLVAELRGEVWGIVKKTSFFCYCFTVSSILPLPTTQISEAARSKSVVEESLDAALAQMETAKTIMHQLATAKTRLEV